MNKHQNHIEENENNEQKFERKQSLETDTTIKHSKGDLDCDNPTVNKDSGPTVSSTTTTSTTTTTVIESYITEKKFKIKLTDFKTTQCFLNDREDTSEDQLPIQETRK